MDSKHLALSSVLAVILPVTTSLGLVLTICIAQAQERKEDRRSGWLSMVELLWNPMKDSSSLSLTQFWAQLFQSWLILSKDLLLSVPQFPHLHNSTNSLCLL